jgi:hypothetical protein
MVMRKLGRVLVALVLAGCGEGEMVEVGRATSPDQGLDAVVTQTRTSGSTATPYQVVMVRKGLAAGKGARLFLADHAGEAPTVAWTDSEHLVIGCATARIWTFRNFWANPDDNSVVAVALACGEKGYRPDTTSR